MRGSLTPERLFGPVITPVPSLAFIEATKSAALRKFDVGVDESWVVG